MKGPHVEMSSGWPRLNFLEQFVQVQETRMVPCGTRDRIKAAWVNQLIDNWNTQFAFLEKTKEVVNLFV